MPKPANLKAPIWGRAALNALELLYDANWRWHAIAAHVSAVDGFERNANACRKKAQQLGITRPERHRTALADDRYDADLRDLMVLDYSVTRMCQELERQYGRTYSTGFVWQRLRTIGGSYYGAWRKRAADRHARGLAGICRKGQGKAA